MQCQWIYIQNFSHFSYQIFTGNPVICFVLGKAVDEVIIENAFLEAFRLLADSFDDVLQSVLNTIEDILKDDTKLKRIKQLEKDISTIELKKAG